MASREPREGEGSAAEEAEEARCLEASEVRD